MRLPPTVSRVWWDSVLWGRKEVTMRPYVGLQPSGKSCLAMNLMVLVPDGMRIPTPWASRPNSLAKDVSHCSLVCPVTLPETRCQYSYVFPVTVSITALAHGVRGRNIC